MVPAKVNKLALMKKSAASEEMGAKPGEYNLPEVAVTGNRENLNKVTIDADEHKSKRWYQLKRKYKLSEPEEFNNTLAVGALPNFRETEDDYKKKPGAIGKVNVRYSDGVVKKLGEKYDPPKTHLVRAKAQVYRKGKYVEGYPEPGEPGYIKGVSEGYEAQNAGLSGQPESDDFGKSDWREWHKSKYPSNYQAKTAEETKESSDKLKIMKK